MTGEFDEDEEEVLAMSAPGTAPEASRAYRLPSHKTERHAERIVRACLTRLVSQVTSMARAEARHAAAAKRQAIEARRKAQEARRQAEEARRLHAEVGAVLERTLHRVERHVEREEREAAREARRRLKRLRARVLPYFPCELYGSSPILAVLADGS
jgi:hypothetical protein